MILSRDVLRAGAGICCMTIDAFLMPRRHRRLLPPSARRRRHSPGAGHTAAFAYRSRRLGGALAITR